MKNEKLEELFQSPDFDIAEPAANHEQRFREKLEHQNKTHTTKAGVISLLLPWMAMAASLLIAFILFQGVYNNQHNQKRELASVSTEMKETQDFYASVIKKELYSLEQEKTPETEKIIQDALKQLQVLETDYEKLKTDLVKSGQDKRVIYAMISNFQQRIDLLNNVLEKVNTINTIKKTPHENIL